MSDEFKKSEPWLPEKSKQHDGFKLPEGYFDTFETRVFDRIEAEGLQRQQPLNILKKRVKRFSLPLLLTAAAAVFILVFGAVWVFNTASGAVQSVASVELSEEEIEAYLLENAQYLDLDQLAMLPEAPTNEFQPPAGQEEPSRKQESHYDIRPEDVEDILNDMTEEELEEIL